MKIIFKHWAITALFSLSIACNAQSVPEHAVGLLEELISVDVDNGDKQVGVLSHKVGANSPTKLAVLLPGFPSVVRPTVENGVLIYSRLTGNFLIRSRRHLANELISTLVVDCRSNSFLSCSSSYQASKSRQEDVDKLIEHVQKNNPTIKEVWLVGTSMGVISSSFMPMHNLKGYTGAIHTASITEPYAKDSYRELGDFDYKKSSVPQFFIHHINDPCHFTSYKGAKEISSRFEIPLITVSGGSEFRGHPCQAFTEHGFMGIEKQVMQSIAEIIITGKASKLVIE